MPSLLANIERYLQQQQALAGDVLYTVPVELRENLDSVSLADIASHTTHTAQSITNDMPKQKRITKETPPPPANTSNEAPSETETLFGDLYKPVVSAPPVSASPKRSTVAANWKEAVSLEVLNENICGCLNCKLGATRTNFVFGVGNPNADILVIGEAPGADEDAQGEPFVGRAGQLLNKILEAIQFKREDVYIANIIKCRPPGNRRPEADEVAECEPYLYKQIELLKPKFILALGLTAVDTLLKKKHTMGAIRGKELEFRGIPMIATYHPAALLRNPEWKRATWEDMQYLRRLYDAATQKEA
jgi:DNA polymerase